MSSRSTPEHITWLGLWANVGLFVAKTVAGLLGRSQVLLADGIHSLSDLVSDFVTLVALRLGRKPSDRMHNYGHGKIEDLAAFVMGIFLFAVTGGIIWRALGILRAGRSPERSLWLVAVALASVIVKEALFRVTLRVGEAEQSSTLVANAWHHRSDAFSSLATLFGTGLFYLSARFTWADAASAIVVAILVGKAAWTIVRAAARDLVDTAPDEKQISKFRKRILEIDGVSGLARIRGRFYSRRVALDLDIEVSGQLSVDEGHALAQKIRDVLLSEFPEIYDVLVHVDPARGHP